MRTHRTGSAMIELALALTLLVPLLLGTFQFGLGLLVYHQLVNAVHAGARYASLRAYDSPDATPSPAYAAAVRNMTARGDPGGAAPLLVGGLRPEDVRVTLRFERGVPCSVTVSLDRFGMGLPFRFLRTLTRPSVTFPYAGTFQP